QPAPRHSNSGGWPRGTSAGHRDLATHPGAGLLDRLTRPQVCRPSRLEEVKDVLRARCRPQGEELVIRIGEGPPRRIVTKRGRRSFGRITPRTFCAHLPNV